MGNKPSAMLTLDLPPGIDEARARLLLAIGLFQEGDATVGTAAKIAGRPYRDFVDQLVERGIAPFPADEADETFEAEMQSVRELVRERRAGSV